MKPPVVNGNGMEWSFIAVVLAGVAASATGRAADPGVITAPHGDEEVCASIYRPGEGGARRGDGPIRLGPGPHLLIDDFVIEKATNLTRRVNRPQRDPRIPNPVVTGKEDGCFQPYLTVMRDPASGRFRIWYGARTEDRDMGRTRIATMESADGIHWIRPPRILADPGPIQFGTSVVDDGPGGTDPSKRFKLAFWHRGGLKIATSPDGLHWTPAPEEPIVRHNHDITNLFRDPLRDRYVATISVYTTGRSWNGERRVTMHTASRDLVHWEKPWYVLTPDDTLDQGQTQFYAMNGYLLRGGLWIGLVKVLRDDLVATGTPPGSFGIGYTTLAWSRDGRHWVRDRTPLFEPDPRPGAWDHAHAWLDFQLPVGDEVFIYYGGYKNGHKVNRFEERQIGLVRIQRDRYVSRDAGTQEGTLRTRPVLLGAGSMTVNANVEGRLCVGLLDRNGKPLPGLGTEDCRPILGDSLSHPVRWNAVEKLPADLRDQPVQIEFRFQNAQLYGFDLGP